MGILCQKINKFWDQRSSFDLVSSSLIKSKIVVDKEREIKQHIIITCKKPI